MLSHKQLKRKQRSISLQRFALAKRSKYDKRQLIEQQKIRKIIKKKKLKKQLKLEQEDQPLKDESGQAEQQLIQQIQPAHQDKQQYQQNLEKAQIQDREEDLSIRPQFFKRKKHKPTIQYMQEQKLKEQQLLWEQERLKQQERKQREEEQQVRQQVRNKQRVKHMKRTSKGQPIMSHQIEGILEKLEREQQYRKK